MTDAPQDATVRVRELWMSGDPASAYTLAVHATKDSLYRFLVHLLRNEEAAREAFQETYLRVYQGLGGYRGDATLTTWVLRIGRNVALNEARRLKVRRGRETPLDASAFDPPAPIESRSIENQRRLEAAMERLPRFQREALVLFYLEDLSVAEVAEITGRPANTVKSDLLRARTFLRDALGRATREPGRTNIVAIQESQQ